MPNVSAVVELQAVCRDCGERKPVSEFSFRRKPSLRRMTNCKKCEKARIDKWRAQTPRFVFSTAMYNIRRLGKRSKNGVTISADSLMELWHRQQGKCALSGLPLTWSTIKGRAAPTSISIDRVDPRRGYTFGNVRLICHAINSFKGDSTDEEMLAMARALVEKTSG